ncbi:hypothetical protein FOMPIDRAFT_1031468 [Fomitopsis schrenkii]|uniref:MATH domain-containing protein n=1 Tax=Fomitopsis schrenkii TaxID=2126942 RepID=S8FJA3_FOMSC|nr:hypothetical protein FOMPIDRAFT_1031468 [Fomitopsis schrenkii]
MEAVTEYQESTTTRLEWTVGNLKTLFEESKGEAKSKVTKSVKFGGGKWQILFYPNSGIIAEGQSYISLYLFCEPTAKERENAFGGKWVRDGVFKFGFELRSLNKVNLYSSKDAHDHSFSQQTQNWGWAQFARRDAVYDSNSLSKTQNAFSVICTITSSPSLPDPVPTTPQSLVPKVLLDSMGGLLDDPIYSDIEFVLPRRGKPFHAARRIYASRRLLKRVEYFGTMFKSGFAETLSGSTHGNVDSGGYQNSQGSTAVMRQFEDSDEEDDEDGDELVVDTDKEKPQVHVPTTETTKEVTEAGGSSSETYDMDFSADMAEYHYLNRNTVNEDEAPRHVRPKSSHPCTPRTAPSSVEPDRRGSPPNLPVPGPAKTQVIVRDAAYATYRAVLYYIYTDTITFAPLSSTFLASAATTPNTVAPAPGTPSSESQASAFTQRPNHQKAESATTIGSVPPRSRREWIAQWERNNATGKPRPCSAKAVYRLSDKLDLQDLKQRAFQHIVRSLTVANVAYEVFSTFSAAFEDVRKVQVRFFLDHWNEIRVSDAMHNVWQQMRLGRHPGFEEVWPMIALNLEHKSQPVDSAEKI